MGCFWLVVALIVLISFENQLDQKRIQDDYERWKDNRR